MPWPRTASLLGPKAASASCVYGGDPGHADLRAKPQFGEAGVVWQPRLGWSLSGTVVALAQGHQGTSQGDKLDAGLSEAYLSFKPLGGGPIKISARAGLMWPPVSIEHSGPEWAVTDTITPSAIGSWMGEEVKVVGLEVTGKGRFGGHELAATIAGFDFNDTAGTLLTFRGWALHDGKALAFRKQPLPPLSPFIDAVQPRYTHPLLDLESGAFKRPGFYGKLAWTAPIPLHVELLHYDNNGDPLAANADREWGWRTQFNSLAVVADLGGARELRAQGLSGRTRMGFKIAGSDWIDMRFRAAYGMLTQRFARGSVLGPARRLRDAQPRQRGRHRRRRGWLGGHRRGQTRPRQNVYRTCGIPPCRKRSGRAGTRLARIGPGAESAAVGDARALVGERERGTDDRIAGEKNGPGSGFNTERVHCWRRPPRRAA